MVIKLIYTLLIFLFIFLCLKVAIEVSSDEKIESRLNVLDELLNTERDYLNDLTTLIERYLVPLRSGMFYYVT